MAAGPVPTGIGPTRSPRHPLRIGVIIVLAVLLVAGGALAARSWRDRRLTLSDQQLQVALLTFRPAEIPGRSAELTAAELLTDEQVRADPATCLPLVRLSPDGGAGAESWTGVSGTPRQPVRLLTVRFDDPAGARRALAAKRAALRDCDRVRLEFPPFEDPAQDFTVTAERFWWLPSDQLSYRLTSDAEYLFYVRRYGNTLTWSWANQSNVNDRTDGAVRRGVVDDLTARLEELVRS